MQWRLPLRTAVVSGGEGASCRAAAAPHLLLPLPR